MVTRTGITPLERKAAFAHAVVLHQAPSYAAAAQECGASWTHLRACLEGDRTPSDALRQRVAEYCEIPADRFWGRSVARGAARSSRRRSAAAAEADLAAAAS